MKNLLYLILSIILCVTVSFIARGQTAFNAQQELTAIYAAQDKAIAMRDTKIIEAFYALDYLVETKQGTINRAESLRNLQKFFDATSKILSAETTLEKVDQIEGAKIAFITRRIKGAMIFAAGKTRDFEINIQSEEHWTKSGKGAWMLHAGVERSQSLKIDGVEENTDLLESSRTEIETVYDKIDAALKAKNLRAVFVYWSPDFVEIQDGKESTSDQVETAYHTLFNKIGVVSNVSHQISEIKTLDGDHTVHMVRTINGAMILNKKKVLFEYSYQARESWTEESQDLWKLKTSAIISDRFLIDGKEVK